jgi:hypothetical protein
MLMTATSSIRVVRPDELDSDTEQTAGWARRAAIAPDLGIETALWGGLFGVTTRKCILRTLGVNR